ncbi:PREDICTED: carboxypeptidase N subunit 2-like [Branchiostoma belcheri]|uniref:Carboxypeptidase N subunit 2-like n=1 Tax=Branchiostoma belcheri TaxID=7741 RepID=A0A6P4Y713_BRABE|nr:PREDICTED: carboxypeptidase N subunit 2-like [Branchiostoma belcheri]
MKLYQTLPVLCLVAAVARGSLCPEYCDCYPGENNTSTIVTCRGGNITRVPTDFPANTTYLDIEFTNITKLQEGDFRRLPVLTSLRIFWNVQLTKLDVETFSVVPTLTDLSISNCSFSKFPSGMLKGLEHLQTFDGGHNLLEMVRSGLFSHHPTLEMINIWQNNISHLEPGAFAGMPRLKSILLMNNMLTSVSETAFSGSPNIQSLTFSFNTISRIDKDAFVGLNRLQSVDLQQNMLTNIDGVFGELPDLKALTLTNNVNLLDSIHNATFGSLPSLANLFLDKNKISVVEKGVLSHLKSLQQLNLGYNEIVDISLTGLTSLTELYVQDNRLSSFPSNMADAAQLQVLELENNPVEEPLHAGQFSDLTRLRRLTLDNVTSLQSAGTLDPRAFCGLDHLYLLSLRYNQLVSLSPDTFTCVPQLTHLYLDHNNITELKLGTFKALTKLTDLYLSYNQLSRISPGTFDGLVKLFFLALGGNNFTNILHVAPALAGLPCLDIPALDDNALVYVGPNSFPDNMAIDLLNLSGNKIRIIEEGAFTARAFPNMTRVWLDEGNPLHFLPEKIVDGLPKFLTLTVGDDPFNCDCQLKGFATWLRNQVNPPNAYLVCSSPAHLKGKYLKDVALEDMTCNCDHEEAPSIDTSGSDNYTDEGQAAILNCNISGCPEAEFFWTTPTGAMLAVGSGFPRLEVQANGSLVLDDARPEDTGAYSCTAVNYRGKDSKEVFLRVGGG